MSVQFIYFNRRTQQTEFYSSSLDEKKAVARECTFTAVSIDGKLKSVASLARQRADSCKIDRLLML